MTFRIQKPFTKRFGAAFAATALATVVMTTPAVAVRDSGGSVAQPNSVESFARGDSAPSLAPGDLVPDPGRPAARPGDGRFDEEAVRSGRPRYIVRARSFHAQNESGVDWLGSDEVYGLWRVGSTLAGTSVFGDVDTGNTRDFKQEQNCIYPMDTTGYLDGRSGDTWDCLAEGASGPIEFDIALWESDGLQLIPFCFDTGIDPEPNCEDDHLGSRSFSYSESELSSLLPAVGDVFVEYQLLGSCEVGVCGESPLDADYFVRFDIIRVADFDLSQTASK